jgi:hypothetical protein
MALDFAKELRAAAWHTETVGADAASGLRDILEDTLTRIKDEIFGGAGQQPPGTEGGSWEAASAAQEDTAEEETGTREAGRPGPGEKGSGGKGGTSGEEDSGGRAT